MQTRFELVIFDCDGVVVDSEAITNRVFGEFVAELGWQLSAAEADERFLGRSLSDCIAIVEAELGRAIPGTLLEAYRERRDRALLAEVEAVEGVREVLDTLEIPYCIASSGDHAKMRATLGATGLLPLFAGRIFSATEVARAKPAPDVFLHAAAEMRADPARTVVIEDTVNGVLAARAAGMTVLAFAYGTDAAALAAAGADATFSRMSELATLLAGE